MCFYFYSRIDTYNTSFSFAQSAIRTKNHLHRASSFNFFEFFFSFSFYYSCYPFLYFFIQRIEEPVQNFIWNHMKTQLTQTHRYIIHVSFFALKNVQVIHINRLISIKCWCSQRSIRNRSSKNCISPERRTSTRQATFNKLKYMYVNIIINIRKKKL